MNTTKTLHLFLILAMLKSVTLESISDGTLPVHDRIGSVTGPITADQGGNSSPDRECPVVFHNGFACDSGGGVHGGSSSSEGSSEAALVK